MNSTSRRVTRRLIPRAREALALREQALGPTHWAVADSLNNLALCLQATGDYAGARPLYERALRIQEQVLGPAHIAVALSLSNLASLLQTTGDYAGARPLYERALRISELVLGPTHPTVAQRLDNIASLLQTTGDYAGARPLYERALRINEEVLGPTHASVARSLNYLALLLQTTGDYAGAHPLYVRALRIREQALGPTHWAVAQSLNNLALLLQTTGDRAGARPLYERALRINEQALGPTHPEVALSLSNLALLLQATGDSAGAQPLLERALRIREQALGSTHWTVAQSLDDLAFVLQAAGDYAGARPFYERARLVDLALSRTNVQLEDEEIRSLRRRFGSDRALRRYVGLLAAIAREPHRDPGMSAPAAIAFVVAEQGRGGSAQAALHRAGARAAAGNVLTAGLARRVQELRDRLAATRKQMVTEYGRPADQRDAARLAAVQQEGARLDQELLEATGQLRTAFPRYAELATPEPIDVLGAQALLRADEALVSYLCWRNGCSSGWSGRADLCIFRDETWSARELRALVRRVRQSADQTGNPNLFVGQLMSFDVARGPRALSTTVRADCDGIARRQARHCCAGRRIAPLPFGALIKEANGESFHRLATLYAHDGTPGPDDLTAYGQLTWLARRMSSPCCRPPRRCGRCGRSSGRRGRR